MKKITILCLHLGYGGIEKAIASLSNMLVKNYTVEIISTYQLNKEPVFQIDSNVQIKYLLPYDPNKQIFIKNIKKGHFIQTFKEGLKAIKTLYLKKKTMVDTIKNCDSDIIISTRDIHNKWLGKYGKITCTKIAWEHNHHHNNKHYSKKIIRSVKKVDYLVLVSKDLKRYYAELVTPTCKCIYIPNCIENIPNKPSKLNNKNIISVGRLEKEKGFLNLITVFKLVTLKDPDVHLDIVGSGSLKEKIEEAIQKYNLQENITMHGFLKSEQIETIYQQASLYVMTSYTESFGIVLVEAMSNGLPCIAFNSAEGAQELISNNIDGYLIPNRDMDKMVKKILEILNDKEKRKKLGENARKKAMRYDKTVIEEEWRKLLDEKETN